MRLTKREKVLLLLLLLIAVVGLSAMYLFVPKLQGITAKQERLSTLQMELTQKQIAVAQLELDKQTLREHKDEAQQLYEALRSKRSYDQSLLLSDMLLSKSLMPVSLQMGERAPTALPGAAQGEEGEVAVAAYTTTAQTDMRFSGEKVRAYAFFDQIADYEKSYLLRGATVEGGAEDAPSQYSILLTVYDFAEPPKVKSFD